MNASAISLGRGRRTALAMALAAVLAQGVQAQTQEGGYAPLTATGRTPVTGIAAPLYPLATPQTAVPGQVPSVYGATSQGGVDYRVNQVAMRLVVEVAKNAVPADGQTPVAVTVRVFGQDGKALAVPVWATIEHSGGRILLPGAATDESGPLGKDADLSMPGVQVKIEQGVGSFSLLSPIAPQDVRLRVTVGDQDASGVVSFVPEMRDMVASGLIEGIINFGGKGSGLIERPRHADAFDREIRAWSTAFGDDKNSAAARAAFFLKGTIQGKYLLTAAYDSDKETRSRLLRDIKTEEFYPVYGDSSLRGEEAVSGSRLYVRLDKDRNYLLWGDFNTGDGFSQRTGGGAVAALQQRSLGNYNRSATGVRYHYDEGAVVGNVFAFRDSLRQVVEEFASQGSGPYGLRHNGVLEGSEKVEVVVRDRDQPSRILTVTPMGRLSDYTFEPFSGRILLNSFLPSADSNLNPMSLRVTYEMDQGGDAFWVVGADGQLRLSDSLEIGGSYVKDNNPLASQTLASANVSWQVTPTTAIVAEVARTTSLVNTNSVNTATQPGMLGRVGDVSGNAWRVELAHEGERTEARVFAGRSDPSFNNLAAPLTGGRGELNAYGAYKIDDGIKLYAQALRSEDRNPGTSTRTAAGVGAEFKLSEQLTLDVGLRSIQETAGTTTGMFTTPFSSTTGLSGSIATGSGGSAVGFGNQQIDPVSGLPVINSSLLPGATGVHLTDRHSDTVRVGLGYRVNEKFTLGGEVERDISGDPRRRYALGGDYQVGERTRLYGRFERQTGLASSNAITTDTRNSDALVFGVNSSVMRDTQLFSEYRLRDAISGRDTQMASGVRNSWDFAPGMRLNTALERVRVLSGNAPNAYAISAGVDYTAHPLWRASTKVEYRRSSDVGTTANVNEGFSTTLWQAMAARKLDRDWTLLGRNYLLKTDYDARGGVLQNRAQVGVAYRDTDTNLVNAIAKYEFKMERDASDSAVGTLSSRAHIVSAHADYHPSRPWWMTGRVAGKWQRDRFENGVGNSFNAQLVSGRIVYDLTENWDLGLMAAAQFGQRGARQTALGVEIGYQLQQNLWLSVGYNRTGFAADRDLVGYEYTRSGAYIRLRFKFDEDLFSGSQKTVNPALDR